MHGITFKTLSIRNFLSFGNNIAVIPLDRQSSVLIEGINLDNTNNGYQSNGTGKSSILNAVVYALYDTPVSNINKDNLVNNINGKHMEVTIEFTKNDIHYKVRRERKMKSGAAGNNAYLFINGEDRTEAGKVNEQILKILGIPYELFVRIVVFTASLQSFLDLKTSDQVYFTEELFGITTLSDKAETLKSHIKQNEQDILIQKAKIDTLEKEHDRHVQQIDNIKKHIATWETNHVQAIKQAKLSLLESEQTYDNTIESAEQQVAKFTKEYDSMDHTANFDDLKLKRKQLDELVTIKATTSNTISKTSTELKSINSSIEKNNIKINEFHQEIVQLEQHTCPYCHQDYQDAIDKLVFVKEEISKLEITNKQLNLDIEKLEQQLETTTLEYAAIQDQISELSNVPTFTQIADMEYAPVKLKQQLDQSVKTLADLKSPNNPYITLINNNTQALTELTNEINPYIELYDELIAVDLDVIDYSRINELTKELEHQKLLLKLLTKKDSFIRKAILNKSIPFLNSCLQHYLSNMDLLHKIEFTHELSVNISLVGRSLNFGNLSAGQRARVNLALSLAFRDVLQLTHSSINLWMLDEILDIGLDNIGVQSAIKLIKRKSKEAKNSLFVISHRDECKDIFDNVLTVEMKKGFSYIA